MKILVNRGELIQVLSELSTIIKDNSIRPVISGAKLEALQDKIKFTGTTLEFNFIKYIDAKVESTGSVAFKVPLVLEYIKLLDEKELEIEVKDNIMTIHRAEFSVLNVEDYPHIEEHNIEPVFNIVGEEFLSSLDMVRFSAFPTLDNLAINCVRIACEDKSLSFISTDSYRLTHFTKEHNCNSAREISVPLESVSIICKLLKGEVEEVGVSIHNNIFILKWRDTYISSRLIEMPFPDYRAILGSINYSKTIELNTADLKKSIKKVMTVAKRNQETKNGSYMEFKGNKLTMTVSSGVGKTTQKLDTIKDGEDFKASLNIKYLYDFIDNISNNVIMRATNSSSMFIIEEHKNKNYKYILMPLALRD